MDSNIAIRNITLVWRFPFHISNIFVGSFQLNAIVDT